MEKYAKLTCIGESLIIYTKSILLNMSPFLKSVFYNLLIFCNLLKLFSIIFSCSAEMGDFSQFHLVSKISNQAIILILNSYLPHCFPITGQDRQYRNRWEIVQCASYCRIDSACDLLPPISHLHDHTFFMEMRSYIIRLAFSTFARLQPNPLPLERF